MTGPLYLNGFRMCSRTTRSSLTNFKKAIFIIIASHYNKQVAELALMSQSNFFCTAVLSRKLVRYIFSSFVANHIIPPPCYWHSHLLSLLPYNLFVDHISFTSYLNTFIFESLFLKRNDPTLQLWENRIFETSG